MIEEPHGLEFKKKLDADYAKIDANAPDVKEQIKLLLGMHMQHTWMFQQVNDSLKQILNKVKQR